MGDTHRHESEGPTPLEPVVNVPSWGRDNYKKWPWASFLSVAVCIGVIFFIAGSPQTVWQAEGSHFILSIGFLAVGSILLLPSVVAIFVLIWIWISKTTGCFLPLRIQRFIRVINGKPPLPIQEEEKIIIGEKVPSQPAAKSSSGVEAVTNTENCTSNGRFTYTNPVMEPYMSDPEDDYDLSRGELVLNVAADGGHQLGNEPSSGELSQTQSEYRDSSPQVTPSGRMEKGASLERVEVWTVPPVTDMANSNSVHKPQKQESHQSHRPCSKRTEPKTTDIQFDSTNHTAARSDDVMQHGVASSAHAQNGCLNTNNTKRKQEAKPTLLSLSESFRLKKQSPRGSHRRKRHVNDTATSKGNPHQRIFIINPQRHPMNDSAI